MSWLRRGMPWAIVLSLALHALLLLMQPPSGRMQAAVQPLNATMRSHAPVVTPPVFRPAAVVKSAGGAGSRFSVARPRAETDPVAPAAPAIDFDAARRIAREAGRAPGGKPGRAAQPASPENVAPLGRAIAESARPDCKGAYAGYGLFAVPLLLKDAVSDSGCRW